MYDELLKVILQYSKEGQYFDSRMISNIVSTFISSYGLNDYLQKLIIAKKGKNKDTVAIYQNNDKELVVFKSGLERMIYDASCEQYLSPEEISIYRTGYVTEILLHELNHIQQYRLMDTSSGNVATLLREGELNNPDTVDELNSHIESLGLSEKERTKLLTEHNKQTRAVYYENYDIDLSERLADNICKHQVISILKPVAHRYPRLTTLNQLLLDETLLFEYDSSLEAPTIRYFKAIGREKSLSKLDFYDSDPDVFARKVFERYGLSARLYLGLPISDDEYDERYQNITSLYKKLSS